MNDYYHESIYFKKYKMMYWDARRFVQALDNSMIALKNKVTSTIGLYGKWGCGKTSILNMLLEELNKKHTPLPDDCRPIIYADLKHGIYQIKIELRLIKFFKTCWLLNLTQ